MDRYHIALFIHIVAVMVATGATAVTKVAAGRRATAKTVADALDWHGVLMSTSKLFPLSLAALVLTGSYMVSVAHIGAWTSGFTIAGYVGVLLLFASGGYLGKQGAALQKMLERLASNGGDQPAPKLVPPPLVAALPLVNTGIALSVVFVMATKPTSIPLALSVIGIGIALGAGLALRRPAPASVSRAPRTSVA